MYSIAIVNGSEQRVIVPENKFLQVTKDHTLAPLRGHGYVLAVLSDGKCVGFVDVVTLGYASVKDWMCRV
jgi:hypothetical protein